MVDAAGPESGTDSAAESPVARARAALRSVAAETARIYAGTPRVLALVWRASPGRVTTLALLTLIQGLLPTASVWVNKLIVDTVVAAPIARRIQLAPSSTSFHAQAARPV